MKSCTCCYANCFLNSYFIKIMWKGFSLLFFCFFFVCVLVLMVLLFLKKCSNECTHSSTLNWTNAFIINWVELWGILFAQVLLLQMNIWFGADFKLDALPDANLLFIWAWERHEEYTSCDPWGHVSPPILKQGIYINRYTTVIFYH